MQQPKTRGIFKIRVPPGFSIQQFFSKIRRPQAARFSGVLQQAEENTPKTDRTHHIFPDTELLDGVVVIEHMRIGQTAVVSLLKPTIPRCERLMRPALPVERVCSKVIGSLIIYVPVKLHFLIAVGPLRSKSDSKSPSICEGSCRSHPRSSLCFRSFSLQP